MTKIGKKITKPINNTTKPITKIISKRSKKITNATNYRTSKPSNFFTNFGKKINNRREETAIIAITIPT